MTRSFLAAGLFAAALFGLQGCVDDGRCITDSGCSGGNICAQLVAGGGGEGLCAAPCTSDDDCRSTQACRTEVGGEGRRYCANTAGLSRVEVDGGS
ncbi:MAG: hypothetical protein AAF447_25335 [Myxococcota bacterium]